MPHPIRHKSNMHFEVAIHELGTFVLSFSSNSTPLKPRETEELSMKQIKQTKKDANLSQTKRKNYAIHIYELLRKVHQVGCVENN